MRGRCNDYTAMWETAYNRFACIAGSLIGRHVYHRVTFLDSGDSADVCKAFFRGCQEGERVLQPWYENVWIQALPILGRVSLMLIYIRWIFFSSDGCGLQIYFGQLPRLIIGCKAQYKLWWNGLYKEEYKSIFGYTGIMMCIKTLIERLSENLFHRFLAIATHPKLV